MLAQNAVDISLNYGRQTAGLDVLAAIRTRRATRSYASTVVSEDTVKILIAYAVRAPSAMNQQGWSFVVIQNAAFLKEISDKSKARLAMHPDIETKHSGEQGHQFLNDPAFDIFYGAKTLIVICAEDKNDVEFRPETDCYLAGENLMLAATGIGLATCPIGFARDVLREPAMLKKMGVGANRIPILPIIVGYAGRVTASITRKPPIIQWVR